MNWIYDGTKTHDLQPITHAHKNLTTGYSLYNPIIDAKVILQQFYVFIRAQYMSMCKTYNAP